MSLKIANDTANGNVILKGQNVAGDRTITMPNLDCELAPRMQLMSAQNSTSGTSIDFTGIPSWAKKITVMFYGVSTSGASNLMVQIGSTSAGIETSNYLSTAVSISAASVVATSTAGFVLTGNNTTSFIYSGNVSIELLIGTDYVFSGIGKQSAEQCAFCGGDKTLSNTLDRIRITTVNGTDTFDAGQINVLYEG